MRIDTDALEKAEAGEGSGTAEEIRELVATVGKVGKPGEQVRCLVRVDMLSEGWDARNVTHILGLRAFASQLLCEQVVGRGLRRASTRTSPSPSSSTSTACPSSCCRWPRQRGQARPATDYTNVHTVRDRHELRIEFPRIVQVVPDIADTLDIDLDAIEPIRIEPRFDPTDTYVEFDLGTRTQVWEVRPRTGTGRTRTSGSSGSSTGLRPA